MAHAEIVQVGHDAGGVAEGHFLVLELKAVGRGRATRMLANGLARPIERATLPRMAHGVAHGSAPPPLKTRSS